MALTDWLLFGLALVLAVASIVLGVDVMICRKEDEETWIS